MRKITVHDCNGVAHTETVYNVRELPIVEEMKKAKFIKTHRETIVNIPCAFDIETTSVDCDKPYGFMYQWQFCMGTSVTFGRTWEEFEVLIARLDQSLSAVNGAKYIVYCHNLPFEFQFMKEFLEITSIFAREKKKPITVRTAQHIEFRCSYSLTNMSLDKLCKNSKGCIYWKKDGSLYDYKKFRTAETPLTELEEEYCYCDVRGLCECISAMLLEDDLSTIPITSTGYVRREFREVMLKNPENRKTFEKLRLTTDQYNLCKKAFRGGNTSSNTLYVGETVENAWSYDLQSSYPAAMLIDKYPMSKFMKVTVNSREKFDRYIKTKACLFRVVIEDVRIKTLKIIPYIATAKCITITNGKFGNGRVISADRIEMVLTDVDWKIINDLYYTGRMVVPEMYIAEYGYLPLDYRKKLLDYFKGKCELKEKLSEMTDKNSEEYKDTEYLYAKFKNRINASYGMMVTDITSPEIAYEDGEWEECEVNTEKALDSYYKNRKSFLSYQHGVWITANARKRLQDMLNVVGSDCIYIDTDSIKGLGEHSQDFKKMNDKHYKTIAELDINIVTEVNENKYYIGDWDFEGNYYKFKTMGSKKYITEDEKGKCKLTLAGVNKDKGGKWFSEHGGCEAFKKGTLLNSSVSGRTVAYYNNEKKHYIKFGECEMLTASNLAIIDSTYELGVTDEYEELITEVRACE